MTHTRHAGERASRHPVRAAVAALAALAVAVGFSAFGSSGALGPSPAGAQGACTPVEVVVARETASAQGSSWLLTGVARSISSRIGGQTSTYHVNYPASWNFLTSVPQGVTDLVRHLNDQAARCPDQKFVLLGYSQGAMVIGDALASPMDRTMGPSQVLSGDAASSVAAVVWFGDPRFRSGESYNAGNASSGANGVYPRRQGSLSAFAGRIRNYCASGDPVCQSGSVNYIAHAGYVWDFVAQGDAASFVDSKV
jgi:Cutinase